MVDEHRADGTSGGGSRGHTKNRRIALVLPPEKPFGDFAQMPIGMLYAATQLRRRGWEPRVMDLRLSEGPFTGREREFLRRSRAVILGTTDYVNAQCYNPSLRSSRWTVKQIRKITDSRLFVAGSHGTIAPRQTRQTLGSEGVLRGEHEVVIPDFVDSALNGSETPRVWPEDGPRRATEDEVRSLGLPAYDLVPVNRYRSVGVDPESGRLALQPSGVVLAARGCPYGCNFCYLLFGERVRTRTPNRAMEEIKHLYDRFGIRDHFFLDYTYTLNEDWVSRMSEQLIEWDGPIRWICQTRPERMSRSMVTTMAEAGCRGVWLGVESPAQRNRRAIDKGGVSTPEIRRAIRMVRDAGLQCFLFLMVGFPDETEDTLRALNRMIRDHDVYYALSELTPRPGTELFRETGYQDQFEEKGWDYVKDLDSSRLGCSSLDRDRLDWFFDFHHHNPRAVAHALSGVAEPAVESDG